MAEWSRVAPARCACSYQYKKLPQPTVVTFRLYNKIKFVRRQIFFQKVNNSTRHYAVKGGASSEYSFGLLCYANLHNSSGGGSFVQVGFLGITCNFVIIC